MEVLEEGKTTTVSSTIYDIVRKLSSGKKINLTLNETSKLHLESEKSIFNLNCLSPSEFPLTDENFNQNEFIIKSKQLLKLLNKCKFSVSNDETRHYLSGIYFHQTEVEDKNYLTAVATDSHCLPRRWGGLLPAFMNRCRIMRSVWNSRWTDSLPR